MAGTAERIRDKIAASKKRGMWMGGPVPLGYDKIERKLVVIEKEARTVKALFRLYLELGNVRRVTEEAKSRGLRSKKRVSKNGNRSGGRPLSQGHIYKLLNSMLAVAEGRETQDGVEYQLFSVEHGD